MAVRMVGTTAQSRRAWARSSPWSMSWVGRHPSSAPSSDTARAQDVERRARRRPAPGASRPAPRGCHASTGHLGGEPPRPGASGSSPVEEELPHVLERALGGQLGGRVLPVVEEALLPADVAHGRLGHDDPLEPARHLGAVSSAGRMRATPMRSRSDTTPTSSSPSTTGRCR